MASSHKKPRFSLRNPSALETTPPTSPTPNPVLSFDPSTSIEPLHKRNAVKLDGYESDSSNEGFDARADARAAAKATLENNGNEEEEDMFADLEEKNEEDDEELGTTAKKRDKTVRFLEGDEIEGQVRNSKAGGHVSADFTVDGQGSRGKGKRKERDADEEDSVSESENEAARREEEQMDPEVGAAGLKVHAPKLDAFNMSIEMEEGRFDSAGNFVRKAADPSAVHDSWMEGLSRKDIKRAREAAEKREAEAREKLRREDGITTSEILGRLIPVLDRGETVLEGLARLGQGARTKKKKWQTKNKNRRRTEMEVDEEMKGAMGSETDDAEKRRKQSVEQLTEAADQLLSRGQTDVYDASKELLIRWYRRETGEIWVEPPPTVDSISVAKSDEHAKQQWEYRWRDMRDGGVINGPYESTMIKAWTEAGFFTDGGVEFRPVGSSDTDWKVDLALI